MPRSANISVENSFVKGLITEATGLNFPENACVDTYDCIFDKKGEVYRRPGLAYEEDSVSSPTDADDSAITEYLWNAVAKNGEITFVVVQVGNTLSFYRANNAAAVSTVKENFTVDISDFKVIGAPATKRVACSFATGNGLLFVAHPYCEPFYVEYSEDTEDITTTQISIQIRDMKGLPNTDPSGTVLRVDYRPTQDELTENIAYNLLNQGWYAEADCAQGRGGSGRQHRSVLAFYYENFDGVDSIQFPPDPDLVVENRYPSEADIWWIYKVPTTSASPTAEVVSAEELENKKDLLGTATAPKGHYILDAFNLDRSTAASLDEQIINDEDSEAHIDVSGIPIESSGYQRPSQIAFYSGRVFYAGVNSVKFNTKIYFTQILDGVKNIDKCYQQQDPTSEQFSDILPTDGGVIEIPEIARIVKLFLVSNALYVFATNGVWRIAGSEGVGFNATDFSVTRVSNVSAESPFSFVDVDGLPLWWNTDGIWTFQIEGPLASPKLQSITNETIKSFYEDIPNASRFYAKGSFNPFTRIVQWLFRSTDIAPGSDVSENYKYDRILNLDLTTGAFYPWTIPATNLQIAGIICIKGNAVDFETEEVTVDTVTVTVDTDPVEVTSAVRSVLTSSDFKYFTLDNTTPAAVTSQFAEFNDDTNYTDWFGLADATDYTSYLVSGYKVRGEGMRKFQSNYVSIFTRNTTPSVFNFSGRWDYASSGVLGRWSQVQRVEMDSIDRTFNHRRLKVRGHGIALNFYVSSETGRPFNIIGWTAFETGNNSI